AALSPPVGPPPGQKKKMAGGRQRRGKRGGRGGPRARRPKRRGRGGGGGGGEGGGGGCVGEKQEKVQREGERWSTHDGRWWHGTVVWLYTTVQCSGFFFFQAEDGIRDWSVTGVQTCALPILRLLPRLIDPAGQKEVVVAGSISRGKSRRASAIRGPCHENG